VGGVLADSGQFDWDAAHASHGRFTELCEPYEGFHGMSQGVKPGARREIRTHGQRRFRIDKRHIRHYGLADDGHLVAAWRVGDDAELRDVGRCPRRGRNADQRRRRQIDLIDALERRNVALVGMHDADALGAVDHAATAERNDHARARKIAERAHAAGVI
jgi:hypothetical protein